MNKFYRKPNPETMKKNRDYAQQNFMDEIRWCKENLQTLAKTKNKFLLDMYQFLVTGSRKITPKMADAIKNGVGRCKVNPHYNEEIKDNAEAKLKPILEKIAMVERLAEQKNDKAVPFIQNVKQYVKNNYRVTKKQMDALNKVYKRCSENLFTGEENG